MLFALSNRVFLGSHLLVTVPVPQAVLRLFGLLRSSGRFVWLPGYAIMAGSVVLALRRKRSWPTATLCLAAATLQIVDAWPLRAAISAAASDPVPALFDRDAVAALAARSDAIEVFPTYCCRERYRVGLAASDPGQCGIPVDRRTGWPANQFGLPIAPTDQLPGRGDAARREFASGHALPLSGFAGAGT
jgi:hypothetical protein